MSPSQMYHAQCLLTSSREEVGWTILLAALERARGGLPPSWALLSAVLHLATEVWAGLKVVPLHFRAESIR